MIIDYLGKKMDSISFDGNLERDAIDYIKQNYYNEDKEKALDQLKKVLFQGQVSIASIYAYYFERVASDTLMYTEKWTINEMLQCDQLIQLFLNRIKKNSKVFVSENPIRNFKTAIRLGGKNICKKPTNFPLKECKNILQFLANKTNGKVYLDPCCGWGVRLLASACLGYDYIGFDVNSNLLPKLNELAEDIKAIKPDFNYKIYEQGSQYRVEELVNTVDFIFTSPPYFNLERYGNNDKEYQDSYRNTTYQEWLELFVDPLIKNCYHYIKPTGLIAFNVKDFHNYKLVRDFTDIAIKNNLQTNDYLTLKNSPRYIPDTNGDKVVAINNDEGVYIFNK